MKKQLVLFGIAFLPLITYGQGEAEIFDDTDKAKIDQLRVIAEADTSGKIWNLGGTFGLNVGQSYFSNWAAGGQNSVSGTAVTNLFAKYRKNRIAWDTSLDLAFGLLRQDNKEPIKTDDRIDLISKLGYRTNSPQWYYSLLFNFRTQFTEGYVIEDAVNVGEPISDFMAPAFSILSAGLDYKPNAKFSALFSPATLKTTIVTVDRLAPLFGVEDGENVRFEIGAFVKMAYTDDIFENVNLLTRIDFFSNYLNNPENIDINWETFLTLKINSWLATSINVQIIYDDDILLGGVAPVLDENGGVVTPEIIGRPRTQIRQIFALGLNLKF
jgi:hypothetical protein